MGTVLLGLVGTKSLAGDLATGLVGTEPVAGDLRLGFFFDDMAILGLQKVERYC